ncbi:hypothetical protein BIZ37_00835 [Photobacterium sp. BZF1]|uniref:hypothetical protein n=1 Tax=Photobacterium sp. BZF1 TaxID=1904457 RepID=UPI001653B7B3|nr:hypothetical protein [Photobacterium sp. BZF1]MBC7001085.1 hypothetical protein [Photobacterium sp. BZF1]
MTYFSENYGPYKSDWIAAYGMDFRYWSETYQYPKYYMEEADENGKHYYRMIPSGSWAGMVAITTSYYDGSEYTDYYSRGSEEYEHYKKMTERAPHEEKFNIALKHATINKI